MLLGEPLGQFHQHAAVTRIPDLVERDDEPEPFRNTQIDLIFAKQPQQFLIRRIAVVRAHTKGSRDEQ